MENGIPRVPIISIDIAVVGFARTRSKTGIATKNRLVQRQILWQGICLAPDFQLSKREERRCFYVQSFQPHKPALQTAHVAASPREIRRSGWKISFRPDLGTGVIQKPQTKIADRMLSVIGAWKNLHPIHIKHFTQIDLDKRSGFGFANCMPDGAVRKITVPIAIDRIRED